MSENKHTGDNTASKEYPRKLTQEACGALIGHVNAILILVPEDKKPLIGEHYHEIESAIWQPVE